MYLMCQHEYTFFYLSAHQSKKGEGQREEPKRREYKKACPSVSLYLFKVSSSSVHISTILFKLVRGEMLSLAR